MDCSGAPAFAPCWAWRAPRSRCVACGRGSPRLASTCCRWPGPRRRAAQSRCAAGPPHSRSAARARRARRRGRSRWISARPPLSLEYDMPQTTSIRTSVVERFLRYVTYDTKSAEHSDTYPSTLKQLVLLDHLVDELKRVGLKDAVRDEHGYVMATIPATSK